jgi:general nucleoside transport system permease protein
MTAAVPAPAEDHVSRSLVRRVWAAVGLPLISIILALIVGAFVIIASELLVGKGALDLGLPLAAYGALFQGAFGGTDALVQTAVSTAPLLLAALGVGFGFKSGLFNIGAQGQYLTGALGAVAVGVALAGAPQIVAIPLSVLAGVAAGALWGFIPGFLKATRGAHEVVTTIMLNYVAISLLAALVAGPLNTPRSISPITRDVGNASLPVLIGSNGHLGILIALVMVAVVWFVLYRTTFGFEVRTVGANPDAARYAGMHPRLLTMLTMTICGGLAGLAGAGDLLGVSHQMTSSFSTTVGFDSIAVALLGRSTPVGILFGAILFGAMRAGAPLMQIQAGIPAELIDVIQGTVLFFLVATPVIGRFRFLRGAHTGMDTTQITRSYGEASR